MMKKYFFYALFIISCEQKFVPSTEENHCIDACKNLEQLNCPESQPIKLKDGGIVSCVGFCNETLSNGIKLKTSCVAKIKTCKDIQDCQ
jgi:hypothetical protein